MWADPKPITNIPIKGGPQTYPISGIFIERTAFPSAIATVSVDFVSANGSNAYHTEDYPLFDEKIQKATGADIEGNCFMGRRVRSFKLPNGTEFCDVAVQMAKAMLLEFGITDPDPFLSELILGQMTYVRKGSNYVHLSNEILERNGVVLGRHRVGQRTKKIIFVHPTNERYDDGTLTPAGHLRINNLSFQIKDACKGLKAEVIYPEQGPGRNEACSIGIALGCEWQKCEALNPGAQIEKAVELIANHQAHEAIVYIVPDINQGHSILLGLIEATIGKTKTTPAFIKDLHPCYNRANLLDIENGQVTMIFDDPGIAI